MTSTTEPVFIWLVGDDPDTGSLHAYAQAWSRWRQGLDPCPSKTVLTWDDDSDPITWNVEIAPLDTWVDGRRPYRIAVKGFPGEVHVLVGEFHALVHEPDLP